MYVNTTQIVLERSVLAAWMGLMTDSVGAAGPLDGSTVAYYVNDVTPTSDDVFSDYTLTDLDGAGPAYTLTWTAAVNLGITKLALLTSHTVIVDPVPDPAVSVYGIVILNAAADTFLGGYRFPDYISIVAVDQFISVDIALAMPLALQTGLVNPT